MEAFNAEQFTAILALIGLVIVVSALLSGLIERSGLPQVAFFLALGAALGPAGLGVINLSLDSPALRIIATLSLVLVLFTDAVSLNIGEVRRQSGLALLVLGPGTLLSAGLIALAGWALLGLSPAAAAVVGAALASTDPVLLRGVLRMPGVPASARQALRLESGLNDVVLLPVVIVAMIFLESDHTVGTLEWAKLALDLFLLGPGAGVAVGLIAVSTITLVRQRIGVRRDYEALYSLGVAFSAYAAAEALHGSGFLAAFAAGMTIAALDVELCDCFLEYGETTAEMALLFTFVILGGSLIWSGFQILDLMLVLFVALAIFIRPVAFLISLARTRLSGRERLLIAWFGPRGLSSLLLVLLPVFARLPGSDRLFAICCMVVLVSVVLHGGSPLLLNRVKSRPATAPAEPIVVAPVVHEVAPPAPVTTARAQLPLTLVEVSNGRDGHAPAEPVADRERLSIPELEGLWAAGQPVFVLDVRTERSFEDSDGQAKGAVRMPPENVVAQANRLKLPKDAWLAAFCTWQNEATSARVAQELRRAGWTKARALTGGWNAWVAAGLPVEPKAAVGSGG